ncbi:MAG: VOC family protein [Candidatus Udaeobacter sp.]
MQRITPMLWFDNQAEEAASFYVSVFKNSKVNGLSWQVTPAKFFAEWVKDPAGLQRVTHEVWQMTKLDVAKPREGICREVTNAHTVTFRRFPAA